MDDLETLHKFEEEYSIECNRSFNIQKDLKDKIKNLKFSLIKDILKNSKWQVYEHEHYAYMLSSNDIDLISKLEEILHPYHGDNFIILENEYKVFKIMWLNSEDGEVLYCNDLNFLKIAARQFDLIIDYSLLQDLCLTQIEKCKNQIKEFEEILNATNV